MGIFDFMKKINKILYKILKLKKGPLRNKEINFFEIGLGCNMGYGPGKSMLTWKEYMPKVQISYLEYDRACAEPFKDKVKNLYIGDQSDFNLLKEIGKTGPYDVIVDDGGHSRKQQIHSLIGLWPFLKPKGVYIIEDIFYSFVNEMNDYQESTFDVIMKLIMLMNDPSPFPYTKIQSNVTISQEILAISRELQSVHCFLRSCAFIKKVIFFCYFYF